VLGGLARCGEPLGDRAIRRRRLAGRVTAATLSLLLFVGVLDGLDLVDAYGPDTSSVADFGGGYRLEVVYATVSRPALATPFEIRVRRDGGFDAPIQLAVSRDYLGMWDENGLTPNPATSTSEGEWYVWEMDPPPTGDTLTVFYDARIEPSAQSGRSGRVAVLDDDVAVAEVAFTTRILP
jgi:hypothetical protein